MCPAGSIGGIPGGRMPVRSGGCCLRLRLVVDLGLLVRPSLMIVSQSLCGVAPPRGRFLICIRGSRSAILALARGIASLSEELVAVPLYVVSDLLRLPLL